VDARRATRSRRPQHLARRGRRQRGGRRRVPEYDAFIEWLDQEYDELEPEDYEPDAFLELFADWRSSSVYEQWQADFEADNWDGWDGESVVSDYETTVDDMYARASPTPPDDDDDPYDDDPYDDDGYENVDQMRDQWDREVSPLCRVRALLKLSGGFVRLALAVANTPSRARHQLIGIMMTTWMLHMQTWRRARIRSSLRPHAMQNSRSCRRRRCVWSMRSARRAGQRTIRSVQNGTVSAQAVL